MDDTTIHQLRQWLEAGRSVVVATVFRVQGSAPRPVGARLLVADGGEFIGSVSGGCVEGEVIQQAEAVLADGRPRRLRFGISDEMSWEVGLACGGTIEVLVQSADPAIWAAVGACDANRTPCVLLTVVGGDAWLGAQAVLSAAIDEPAFPFPEAVAAARGILAVGYPEALLHPLSDGGQVLLELLARPLHLIVVGGVDAANVLTGVARLLDYRVTVVDPRRRFADADRFPGADRVLQLWPGEALNQLAVDGRTAIVVLTHDPKIDQPALEAALRTDAFYVGAIGSRKTQAARKQRLAERGLPADKLARLYAPIGLDLGGASPAELALSILAEVVAVRHRRAGGHLRDR